MAAKKGMVTVHEHTTPGISGGQDEYHRIKVKKGAEERIEHFLEKGYEIDEERTKKSLMVCHMRILKTEKEARYEQSRERRAELGGQKLAEARSKNDLAGVQGITAGEKKTLAEIATRLPENDPVVSEAPDDEDLSDQ